MQIGDVPSRGIFNVGVTGVQRNLQAFRATVEKIAKTEALGDLPGDMVELTVRQRGAEASMVSIRAADEMVGTLLDVLA